MGNLTQEDRSQLYTYLRKFLKDDSILISIEEEDVTQIPDPMKHGVIKLVGNEIRITISYPRMDVPKEELKRIKDIFTSKQTNYNVENNG